MVEEGWAMVPREDRPSPEALIGYKSEFLPDPDYTHVDGEDIRRERAAWLSDYRRKKDEERDKQSGHPLPGHNNAMVEAGRRGFDPNNFSMDSMART